MVSCRFRVLIYFLTFTFFNFLFFSLTTAYKITLDTESDVIPGIWNLSASCIYLTHANDTNEDGNACLPTGHPQDIGDGRTGFWTTCQERRCVISFQLSQNGNYKNGPISLGVSSYLTGRQNVGITAHVGESGDIVQSIGKIEETGNQWNSTVFPLEKFDWTSNSRIEFVTNLIPDKIDLIDKIEIEFPDVQTTILPTSTEYPESTPTNAPTASESSTHKNPTESSTSENPETSISFETSKITTTRRPRPTRPISPTSPPKDDDDSENSDTVQTLTIAIYALSIALVSLVSCLIGACIHSRYRRRRY